MPGSDGPTMHYCIDTVGSYDGTFDGENVLVSAGLAYRNPGSGLFNIHVPDDPAHLMVDSGGFQAATRWNGARAGEKGLYGRYPYSPEELHAWGDDIGADVVAGMDVACEEAVELFDFEAGHIWPGHYQDRMWQAFRHQLLQRDVYERGDYNHDLMPVIQGKDPADYETFIGWMAGEGLDQYHRIALGTVCKRSDLDEILEVTLTVRDHYPDKWLHLFGATLNVYKDRRFDGLFDSSDTAAWNWGADSKEHKKELFGEYRGKVDDYADDVEDQMRLMADGAGWEENPEREGWELDVAERLVERGVIQVGKRQMVVEDVDPQIGFLDAELRDGVVTYHAEINYSESLGLSVELAHDEVVIPDE